MTLQQPNNKNKRNLVVPRWFVPPIWGILILIIHFILPWLLSQIGLRHGWKQGDPSWWNLVGVVPIAIGLGLYTWCLVFHFRTYTSSVRMGFTPPMLVTEGPYQISRNPMYLSALFAWSGWPIFYGNLAVLIALLMLWTIFSFSVIPKEERQLTDIFGDEYIQYQRSIPKWIGPVRSDS